MATITSFQVDHPNALQHVVWTEKYLLVGTISGFLNILDLQCRHVGSLTSCEHRRTMQVTKSWGLDCCADVLATGGEDGKICLWNLRTGYDPNPTYPFR
jgi:WD40 repeat protein